MSDGKVEMVNNGTVIYLTVDRLKARYRFSSQDDCRQAEMLAEQIARAYQDNGNQIHS